MESATPQRQSAEPAPRRRQRARRVCLLCHDRKLKCDLDHRSRLGKETCSNCAKDDSLCRPWVSKRQKRARHQQFQTSEESQRIQSRPGVDEGNQLVTRFTPLLDEDAIQTRPCEVSETVPAKRRPTVSSFGDSGFLTIFDPEHHALAASDNTDLTQAPPPAVDFPDPSLLQSFGETYLSFCWPWCPVFDKADLEDGQTVESSPLIANALALLGSHIRPPLVQGAVAAQFYQRAKMLFYEDKEPDPLKSIQAIMLFYWWVPRGPSVVHKDASWWWTSLAIKLAQQLGLHREPRDVEQVGDPKVQSLRRRIWWTLFARERLTSICQGRPCTIHPEDCDVQEPSVADFPDPNDMGALVFVHWVHLCAIVGRVGHYLQHSEDVSIQPEHIQDLIAWINGLPSSIRLDITGTRTTNFHRDIHSLHMPYLATFIIIHLSRSSKPLPEARMTAVLAASCMARLFRDLLARGDLVFLGAISCWHAGIATLALLQTQHVPHLAEAGLKDICTLRTALDKIGAIFPSAHVFTQGFERLLQNTTRAPNDTTQYGLPDDTGNIVPPSQVAEELESGEGDWRAYFPFVGQETSSLAAALLSEPVIDPWIDLAWLDDPAFQLDGWFDGLGA